MSKNKETVRNDFVLHCNGASGSARSRRKGSSGREPTELWTFGGARNVRLIVGDITDAMSMRLPAPVVDLLELASLVYAADQCCRRTPGRRFDYGQWWRRNFHFHVAVRLPEFWSRPAVHDALCDTLHFLSEDDYTFSFEKVTEPPPVQEYITYDAKALPPKDVEEVMLMSGGLDSLAGAVERVIHQRRRVAMVSHKPVTHLAKRQRDIVRAVGDHALDPELMPFHVPVAAHKFGLEEHDVTQRSRSFLYASLGAAVAHLFGLSALWFYENGVTSVNLPLCAQEVGGRATRTTHPQVLHGFERLFSEIFQRPFQVSNGFFWHTKQDVIEVLQRCGEAPLARTSVSCSHTRTISQSSPHCGLCSQCLSRRIAALGASLGVDDPGEGYRKDPLLDERTKDEDRTLAERFIGQARQVARMTAVQQFNQQYAGELSRVYPYMNMRTAIAADKMFDLHHRHAQQVSDAVVLQIKSHAEDVWSGMLTETSALSYAVSRTSGTPDQKPKSRISPPRIGMTAIADIESDEALDDEGSNDTDLHVDHSTFTIHFGTRKHRFSVRTKLLFSLLARISRRQGHHVPFDELRQPDGPWNDVGVEDSTITGAVSRLRTILKAAKMPALAERIATGTIGSGKYVVLMPKA